MNAQIKLIADRVRELREILEISPEALAKQVGISLSEYLDYESAKTDIPIGVLYGVANVLQVDPTVLLTGEAPRMVSHTIVRKDGGIKVERYQGYDFSSLAFNYIGRDMEPMLVTLAPTERPELVSHGGQEFNYILEGTIELTIGNRTFVLNAGDSAYFDPSQPHGQRAVATTAKFLTVINE